ncbi:MAG TPA: MFS transporter [Trebonia sp.]|jgi:putative MFS transporter|nr:MFS transporter [Trebonia sp.]
MLLVMTLAVTIDVMKPTTLAFVQPGMAKEYGLRSALSPHASGLPVALLPLAGIGGTVIGSFLWGWLGDRIGRKAPILLAALNRWIPESPRFLLLSVFLAVPVATKGTLAAVLTAYCAEVYPTRVRSSATGLAAGASKAGGVVIIALVAGAVAMPSLTTTALLGGIPLIAAILGIAVFGVETRGHELEDIIAAAPSPALADGAA